MTEHEALLHGKHIAFRVVRKTNNSPVVYFDGVKYVTVLDDGRYSKSTKKDSLNHKDWI